MLLVKKINKIKTKKCEINLANHNKKIQTQKALQNKCLVSLSSGYALISGFECTDMQGIMDL